MHADGAVHAIVEHDRDERQIVLNCSRKFLAIHQEVAVAGNAHDLPLGIQPLHRHCRRNAIAHRAGDRRDVLGEATKAKEPVNPGGVIAGAVANDGIGSEIFAQPHHHRAEIHCARLLGRLFGPGQIVGMSGLGVARRSADEGQAFQRCRKRRRRRINRKVRTIDAAELFGARMHVHARHLRPGNIEEGVMLRGQFAQASADNDRQV